MWYTKPMKSKLITKADMVLAAVLLVLGLTSPFFLRAKPTESTVVRITVDGAEFGSYPLDQDRIVDVNGGNTVVIQDGKVWVSDANCPGKDCMDFGKIGSEGQVIACLPHRMLVMITGGGNGPDFVVE